MSPVTTETLDRALQLAAKDDYAQQVRGAIAAGLKQVVKELDGLPRTSQLPVFAPSIGEVVFAIGMLWVNPCPENIGALIAVIEGLNGGSRK